MGGGRICINITTLWFTNIICLYYVCLYVSIIMLLCLIYAKGDPSPPNARTLIHFDRRDGRRSFFGFLAFNERLDSKKQFEKTRPLSTGSITWISPTLFSDFDHHGWWWMVVLPKSEKVVEEWKKFWWWRRRFGILHIFQVVLALFAVGFGVCSECYLYLASWTWFLDQVYLFRCSCWFRYAEINENYNFPTHKRDES